MTHIPLSPHWLDEKYGYIRVSKQYHHHHAAYVMNAHPVLTDNIISSLDSRISIKPIKRTKQKKSCAGINADDLNKRIRALLDEAFQQEIKFEVNEDHGVFYHGDEKGAIGGFDFAFINQTKNIISLRNLCFGELHYEDGKKRWDKYIERNPTLKDQANDILNKSKPGKDTSYYDNEPNRPIIVGEIQFGNWGLVYRDFFKVLKANVQNSIDSLIYIVPTGKLESLLSDGIVTYDKTVALIKDFEKVINVPVWVVGLDIDTDREITY